MKPIPGRLLFQAHSSLSLLIQIGHSRSDIVIKTPLSGWELARAKRSLIVHSTPRSTFNSTFARSFAAPPLHLTNKASFREMPSRALFFPQQTHPEGGRQYEPSGVLLCFSPPLHLFLDSFRFSQAA
jgi:hypothetical protein